MNTTTPRHLVVDRTLKLWYVYTTWILTNPSVASPTAKTQTLPHAVGVGCTGGVGIDSAILTLRRRRGISIHPSLFVLHLHRDSGRRLNSPIPVGCGTAPYLGQDTLRLPSLVASTTDIAMPTSSVSGRYQKDSHLITCAECGIASTQITLNLSPSVRMFCALQSPQRPSMHVRRTVNGGMSLRQKTATHPVRISSVYVGDVTAAVRGKHISVKSGGTPPGIRPSKPGTVLSPSQRRRRRESPTTLRTKARSDCSGVMSQSLEQHLVGFRGRPALLLIGASAVDGLSDKVDESRPADPCYSERKAR